MDTAFTGVADQLGITAACRLTGRSRATHYRALKPPAPRGPRTIPVQPSALTAEERAVVMELMNSPEYAELPPAQIWARELDAGRYHCSISTMYRILREHGPGRRAPTPGHPPGQNGARAGRHRSPRRSFTWDITKLARPGQGHLVPGDTSSSTSSAATSSATTVGARRDQPSAQRS